MASPGNLYHIVIANKSSHGGMPPVLVIVTTDQTLAQNVAARTYDSIRITLYDDTGTP
jgi:hypothetical protein